MSGSVIGGLGDHEHGRAGQALSHLRENGVMEVRAATPVDTTGYLALYEVVAAEGTWIGAELPLDHDRVKSVVEEALTSPSAQLFVASEAEVVVGAIYLRADGGVVGLGMMIAADFRHRGIGRGLLDRGIAWARSIGAHKVALEVWPHNAPAIALYSGAGFVIEGRLRRHHRRSSGQLWDSVAMGVLLDIDSPGSPHPDAITLTS